MIRFYRRGADTQRISVGVSTNRPRFIRVVSEAPTLFPAPKSPVLQAAPSGSRIENRHSLTPSPSSIEMSL